MRVFKTLDWIEQLVAIWYDTEPIQCMKYTNTYLNVIYTRKGLCLSKKMWLSAALLLTMVSTLLEVFIFGHYGPPSTGRIPQLAYNTNLKQGATKLLKLLNKCLLMVTFENGKIYSIRFEMKKALCTALTLTNLMWIMRKFRQRKSFDSKNVYKKNLLFFLPTV